MCLWRILPSFLPLSTEVLEKKEEMGNDEDEGDGSNRVKKNLISV